MWGMVVEIDTQEVMAVKAARKIREANRAELARACKVTRPHVSQVLSGKSVPSLSVAAGIAKGLGVSLDQLWEYLQTASVN